VNANLIQMQWDAENRLISLNKTTSGGAADEKVVNTYDALHRRILKRHFDAAGNLLKQNSYAYDGWNVVEERESKWVTSGNPATNQWTTMTRRYTWGADVSGTLQGAGGVGGLLMAEEVVGTSVPVSHYYHYDGNGNVIALTDSTGALEGRYRYNAFGQQTELSAGASAFASTQPYRFSTKYLDAEIETSSGLYYYGYRYYLPSIGRWPSRDPIGEKGGRNLYGMVENDGVNKVDVLGMFSNSIVTEGIECKKGAINFVAAGLFQSYSSEDITKYIHKWYMGKISDHALDVSIPVLDKELPFTSLVSAVKDLAFALNSARGTGRGLVVYVYQCCLCKENSDTGVWGMPAMNTKYTDSDLYIMNDDWQQLNSDINKTINELQESVSVQCGKSRKAK
jgi:RHS repeat-associated protein